MIEVSNADRVVFPAIGRTKGDVVRYYERIAERALVHVIDRPLSIRRYPKGLAGPGFFQKNVPPHYPEDIQRFPLPRSKTATKKHRAAQRPTQEQEQDVTLYPVVRDPSHLAYLANQGAIELHVPTARVSAPLRPDRLVIDLDPPAGAVVEVRRAAHHAREALSKFGLDSVPVATGSKGYHVVAPIEPTVETDVLASAVQKLAALLVAEHPDELTLAFRIAMREKRVFVDWLRIGLAASVVAPYSLRATERATVATPLAWSELEGAAPDAFTLADAEHLLDRPDPLADLAATPSDPAPFVAGVEAAFERSGLTIEPFDRFRS